MKFQMPKKAKEEDSAEETDRETVFSKLLNGEMVTEDIENRQGCFCC